MNKMLACIALDAAIVVGMSAALVQASKIPLPEYFKTEEANRKAASMQKMPWKWSVTSKCSSFFSEEPGEVNLQIMADKEIVLSQSTFFPSIKIRLKGGEHQVYFSSSVPLRHEENAEVWMTFPDSVEAERWVLEPAPTYRVLKIVEGAAMLEKLANSKWVKINFQPLRSDKPLEAQYTLQPMPGALVEMERIAKDNMRHFRGHNTAAFPGTQY